MFAGLPGSGISGLVYLFAALCAPVHEAGRRLSGESGVTRWRTVAFLASMSAAILLACSATIWLVFFQFRGDGNQAGHTNASSSLRFLLPFWFAGIGLMAVEMVLGLIRVVLRHRSLERSRPDDVSGLASTVIPEP